MRILIATAGSRGDIAPYTGPAVRLREAGHEVAIATHTRFEGLVRAAGVDFRPLPVDPREELASDPGQRLLEAGGSPLALARLLHLGRRFMPELGEGLLAAARQGCDLLLLSTTTAPMGDAVAEALGVQAAGLYLQPLTPTRAFPPAVATTRWLGRSGNHLAGHAVQAVTDRLFGPAVAGLRRTLGLRPLGVAAARRRSDLQGRPVLFGFSPTVVARPADWPVGQQVAGYWWPHPSADHRPPPGLAEFLDAGPPPVYIGFGSRVVRDADRLGDLLGTALRRSGLRAVVQPGWTGLTVRDAEVFTVDEVPHAWLFPRVAAVVHHCGAGTTAAGLRAGVPAVPVPAQLGAPFWAARLTALGVAAEPLPLRTLTAARLATALRRAVDDPVLRHRARTVAARIAAEDGAARVVETVGRLAAD
ncbi:glycosyltransferase [Kitasatospora camelliae]|uniref:Glycosyltransferase n=1 Tax=Kitasatospora camelliae TaxID=3156397 RepID=A0AAU8K0G6_9ACTN